MSYYRVVDVDQKEASVTIESLSCCDDVEEKTIKRVLEIMEKLYDSGETGWNAALEYSAEKISKEFGVE